MHEHTHSTHTLNTHTLWQRQADFIYRHYMYPTDMFLARRRTWICAETKTHTHTYTYSTRLTHTRTEFSIPFGAPRFSLYFSPPHFSPSLSLSALVGFCFSFSFFTSLFRVFLHSIFVVIFFFVGTGKMNFRFVC